MADRQAEGRAERPLGRRSLSRSGLSPLQPQWGEGWRVGNIHAWRSPAEVRKRLDRDAGFVVARWNDSEDA